MTERVPAPSPGIYEKIPFETYAAWDAINNSSLSAAMLSPRHYRESIEQKREPTEAMEFGTLVHNGQLDPKELLRKYAVMPDFTQQLSKEYTNPRATKEYKELVADWELKHKDKTIVDEVDFERMSDMCCNLYENPISRELLGHDGPAEVSFVWEDAATGLLCKGRIDKLHFKQMKLADLKTCQSANEFEVDIARRKYHRQGAFYIDGLFELTGEWFEHWIVAVEKTAPYGVKAAPLSGEAVVAGRHEYRTALRALKPAIESGVFEGYSSPAAWSIPGWAQPSITLNGPLGPITF